MELYKIALAAYIPLAFFLMLDRKPGRGFTIAVLGGIMLLPSGRSLVFSGLPEIDKIVAVVLGVLLGTVVFHFDTITKLRLRWYDALFALLMGSVVLTSVSSGKGAYDGLSSAARELLTFAIPVLLARIHLRTPEAWRCFLLGVVWASVLYLPMLVWEARMSPQLHTQVYGYFPHVFAQAAPRMGLWRPVVFFGHPLYLARFYAFAAFLALLPMRPDLKKLSSQFGPIVFLAPLLGLLITQSVGPYMMFALLCGLYLVISVQPRVAFVPAAGAVLWVTMIFAGYQPMYGVVRIFEMISPARAHSLQYRLDALQEYRGNIVRKPLFGHGGWKAGRIEGRATDSAALIHSLRYGFVGAGIIYGWWLCALVTLVALLNITRGSPLGRYAAAAAALLPVCLMMVAVDQALDPHVIAIVSGGLAIDSAMRALMRQRPFMMAARPMTTPTGRPEPARPRAGNRRRAAW